MTRHHPRDFSKSLKNHREKPPLRVTSAVREQLTRPCDHDGEAGCRRAPGSGVSSPHETHNPRYRIDPLTLAAAQLASAQSLPQPRWTDIERETLEHFQAILRIDTRKPPGNETRAAEYIESVFDRGVTNRVGGEVKYATVQTLEKRGRGIELYRDYESRDPTKVLDGLPEDFCFEWPFDPNTARFSGICHGKNELAEQLKDIAANFQFNAYRPLNILVDGDSAAAQLQLDITSVTTGRRFSARIAHFWSFKDGVPIHLVEYMDTALVASESGAPSEVHGDT